jgi:hypothetical protein
MAGYDGFSMSNNAVDAYESGRMPASKIAKKIGRGATARGVAAVLQTAEWHHTSSWFTETKFYDFDEAVHERSERDGVLEEAARSALIDEIVVASKAGKVAASAAFLAAVSWLEWGGTRNRPTATRRTEWASVVEKGEWYSIEVIRGGQTFKAFRKNRNANGFEIRRLTERN